MELESELSTKKKLNGFTLAYIQPLHKIDKTMITGAKKKINKFICHKCILTTLDSDSTFKYRFFNKKKNLIWKKKWILCVILTKFRNEQWKLINEFLYIKIMKKNTMEKERKKRKREKKIFFFYSPHNWNGLNYTRNTSTKTKIIITTEFDERDSNNIQHIREDCGKRFSFMSKKKRAFNERDNHSASSIHIYT